MNKKIRRKIEPRMQGLHIRQQAREALRRKACRLHLINKTMAAITSFGEAVAWLDYVGIEYQVTDPYGCKVLEFEDHHFVFRPDGKLDRHAPQRRSAPLLQDDLLAGVVSITEDKPPNGAGLAL